MNARPWDLVNSEEMHRRWPDTFDIPSAEDRSTVPVGAVAKLKFFHTYGDPGRRDDFTGESMWVLVTETKGQGYVGTLVSRPQVVPIPYGTEVDFESRHIIDIIVEPEQAFCTACTPDLAGRP
jgi:hypothetical protein